MRIFLGLKEIGGYYQALSAGFKELGVDCTQVDLSDHPFGYPRTDKNNLLVNFDKWAYRKHEKSRKLTRLCWAIPKYLSRLLFFSWAMIKHDIFIFGFATSFFYFYELPLLKMLGKKIIYIFHGSDARPPYADGAVIDTVFGESSIDSGLLQKITLKRFADIRKIERFADHIINTPAQSPFFTRPYWNNLTIGFPYSIVPETPALSDNGLCRVVHFPSHRFPKGSDEIAKIVGELKSDNINFEFVTATGLGNTEVLSLIRTADVVIDQLYSDMPLAGIATESAFLGKAVIVGGYFASELASLPELALAPTVFCLPENFKENLKKLITDTKWRLENAVKLHDYVVKTRLPKVVAKKILSILDGSADKCWLSDPVDNRYFFGYGLSKKRYRILISEYIKACGEEALMLAHHPKLKKAILAFVN